MWSEETINRIKVEVIETLLNYSEIEEKRTPQRHIQESDNQGWIFLEELQRKIDKKFLNPAKSWMFTDLPFIEDRTRKTPFKSIKKGFRTIRIGGALPYTIGDDPHPHRSSAYRIRRTAQGWKQAYLFLLAMKKIELANKSDYGRNMQPTIQPLYEQFYDALGLPWPVKGWQGKTLSKAYCGRSLSQIAISLFRRFLENPLQLRQRAVIIKKELQKNKTPYDYHTLLNSLYIVGTLQDDGQVSLDGYDITLIPMNPKWALGFYEERANKPIRKDADGRTLEILANSPVLPPETVGETGGDALNSQCEDWAL